MRDCTTCAAYLGAGQCRENLESECAAGGGYEAHRPKRIFRSLQEMAEYADYLIAFWDGKSRGTRNMIEIMKKLGKHGEVYYYGNSI